MVRSYRKIPKIGPTAWPIFLGAYIRRGLSTEGNLRFKIDWASLRVGSKFTVFALSPPPGNYIWRGGLTEVFFALPVRGAGLIFGGAYFRNITVFHAVGYVSLVLFEEALFLISFLVF